MQSPTSDLRPPTSESLPRALWTPLFLALEPHLSQRAGLFAYGHDFLRQAVEAAFAAEADPQSGPRTSPWPTTSSAIEPADMTPRKAAEWPFQLHAAQAWERLEACLTDIPLFLALYNDQDEVGTDRLLASLARSRQARHGRMLYRPIERWSGGSSQRRDHFVPAHLGQFLSENGLYSPPSHCFAGRSWPASGCWGRSIPTRW
jgi:hypothetical protein